MGTEDAGTGGGRARGTTKNAIDESILMGGLGMWIGCRYRRRPGNEVTTTGNHYNQRRMGTEDAGTGGVRARGTTNQPITTTTIKEA